MSIDINAEIAAQRHRVFEQLNEANPDVDTMVEAIENELEYVFDNFFDMFDEYFTDNGIAVNSYEGLREEDEPFVMEWQEEHLNKAIARWHKEMAARYNNKERKSEVE